MQLIQRALRRLRKELGFIRRRFISPRVPVGSAGVLLHIGCGDIDAPGFINVDAQPYPHVHHVRDDITDLAMFADASADLVYMCHVLEHVPRRQILDVLAEMRRVLRPGGVLRISVPDFDRLVDIYCSTGRDPDRVIDPLLGSHANAYDVHYWIFTRASLSAILMRAGFDAVRDWDPLRCAHHDFEDWASRPLENAGGRHIVSLNLEAVR